MTSMQTVCLIAKTERSKGGFGPLFWYKIEGRVYE